MAVDDILQDVYLKIHHNIANLRDRTRLSSYVFRIARNAIHDHYRSSSRTTQLEVEPVGETSEERFTPHSQVALGLRIMILTLPPKYTEALLLSEIEGYTQAEVARALNLSLSGAKSRVQRGRKLLKQALLDCCRFEFDRRGTIIDYHPHQCNASAPGTEEADSGNC